MAPQDSFIDDDEESCPLCVEEFDLSDKNFRPCPCGYQICQFCFNNIRTNLNGLCPACRRPYDDSTIEWKKVTQEEMQRFKLETQKKAKKNQEQRQKEAQKREVETLNRKHLSGLRVLQKNLVYVVGLSPGIPEQEILSTLRGDRYFGQYGKIVKIVVSNKKTNESGPNGQSLGVYVTFARNEDAARCIAAVNGSQNGDRVLRAQLGTTKYCSAYLRNETCTNKNCMFLHEPGDNNDSYSRQDLSSLNSVNTQRPLPSASSPSASSSRQAAQIQAPIQQGQPVAAATHPMVRDNSKDGSDGGDASALPASVSWANKGLPERSRRGSVATSGAASSPAFSQAVPATAEVTDSAEDQSEEQPIEVVEDESPIIEAITPEISRPARDPILLNLLRAINSADVSYTRPTSTSDSSFPPLFDSCGGEKRRATREGQQEEERLHINQDTMVDSQPVAEPAEEEAPESGSLQLGGEPEDRHEVREIPMGFNRRPSTQLPIQRSANGGPFGPSLPQNFPQNLNNLSSINGRTLTPQQMDQLRLGTAGQSQSPGFMEQYPPGMRNQLAQGSSLFQQQGHNRQSSRYSFANDGSSSASSVKPSANPKLMAQQSSMMPSAGSQFYGSSMPGPPPGLKSSGTPPIGGMFGQSHAFGNSMGANSSFGLRKDNSNSEMLQDILRNRGAVGGQSHDTGKHDLGLLSLDEAATSSVDALVADGPQDDFIVAAMPDMYDRVSRTSTPSIPPGLSLPHAHPPVGTADEVATKPASRILPTTAPFQPTRSASFIPRAATPLAQVVNVPPQTIQETLGESSRAQNKQDVKNLATSSGLSKAIASQATQPSLKSEDFPALESGKAKPKTPLLATKKPAKTVMIPKTKKLETPSGSSKVIEKKAPLSVSVATESPSSKIPAGPPTPGKPTVAATAFPPLPVTTPSVASVQSPLLRKAPTTLRLTSTPKTEIPTGSATPSSATSMFPPTFPSSRQPSLASVSRMDRPGTPTSEMLSDNASITSASMSRASSPPPSNLIGSAPVRTTTKSMQRKQRKEVQREKEKAELEAAVSKPDKEPEIAPILGRKKKVKKERPIHSATGGSTPIASRPPSPGPSDHVEVQKANETVAQQQVQAEEKNTSTDSEVPARDAVRAQDSKAKGKAKLQEQASPEPAPTVSEADDDAMVKPMPTLASIMKELVNEGAVDDLNELALFKPTSTISRHPEPLTDPALNHKLTVTSEDRTMLLAGQAVRKAIGQSGRVMLTPNGNCVRNLTEEEEDKYLNLQARLAEESGPATFVSSRNTTNTGFTLIEGRAVPNGPPPYYPTPAGDTAPIDPVAKINRDEALDYINQYVLPSLSNSMQEQALVNTALNSDVMRSSSAAAAWTTSWGTDPTAPHLESNDGSYGPSNREGMIATGIESMTAHFAISGDMIRNTPSTVSLLSLSESETAMQHARKDAESLEKRLNALIKKNRRLVLGASH